MDYCLNRNFFRYCNGKPERTTEDVEFKFCAVDRNFAPKGVIVKSFPACKLDPEKCGHCEVK